MSKRRPTDSFLTLIEIGRWTIQPRAGMDDLLTAGRIDADAVRHLNSLALLITGLGGEHLTPALSLDGVQVFTAKIAAGDAVEEEEVMAIQRWLDVCTALLRRTRRSDYQAALTRLIRTAEDQV